MRPATAEQKKSEKPCALIFGTVWGPDKHPMYGVTVRIRVTDAKKPRWELYSERPGRIRLAGSRGQADYLARADLKRYKYNNTKVLLVGTEVMAHIEYDRRTDIGLHLR